MENKLSAKKHFSELSQYDIDPVLAPYFDLDFCTSNHLVLLDDPAIENLDKIELAFSIPMTQNLSKKQKRN